MFMCVIVRVRRSRDYDIYVSERDHDDETEREPPRNPTHTRANILRVQRGIILLYDFQSEISWLRVVQHLACASDGRARTFTH